MTNKRPDIEDEILVIDTQFGRIKALDALMLRWQKRLWLHAYQSTTDYEPALRLRRKAGVVAPLN